MATATTPGATAASEAVAEAAVAEPACPPREARTVSIGPRTWQVEVAASVEERTLGLSRRTGLAPDQAMWFVLPTPGIHGFWMQDMQFAIDLAWVTPRGRIAGVETLSPCTQAPCPVSFPPEPVLFVLETRAGEMPAEADQLTWSCQP
jgi:uncharacterized protein